ncbi:MAG: class I SAM-dependent methyltransferase, partial [Balneolales bacterium]
EQARVAWDTIATGFDNYVTPFSMAWAEKILPRVNLQPGMRFLDVATGSGALSIPAARLGAKVISVDISPAMIERLNDRASKEGISNMEGYVMDGQALELSDDTFDIAASMNGVSLFPDLERGLSELVRVTKPEGKVIIIAFGPPQNAEWLVLFMDAMQASVPGFINPLGSDLPLPFQVSDPDKLRTKMEEAGLKDIRLENKTFGMECRSATQLWDIVTNSNPIGAKLVANLDQEQITKVKQELENTLHKHSESPTTVLKTDINIGIGTK